MSHPYPDLQDCVDTNRIAEVVEEIERRKKARRDIIHPVKSLRMDDDGRLVLGAAKAFLVGDRTYFTWADAEAAADKSGLSITTVDGGGAIPLSRLALGQLAQIADIPLRYIESLQIRKLHDLVSINFSRTLQAEEGRQRLLIRILDDRVRAVLSDSYRIMDNCDLFFAAAQELQDAGAIIWKARLTDTNFEMLAVAPDLHGEVRRQFDQAGGYHHAVFQKGGNDYGRPEVNAPPDLHNALVRIRNSETGHGGLSVAIGMLRRACNNTLILSKALSVIHLGRKQTEEGLIDWSQDTKESESRTVWLKMRDTIRTAFDRTKFDEGLRKLSGLAEAPLDKPEAAVANVCADLNLTEDIRSKVLRKLFESRDLSRFGLVQAITAQANDADDEIAPLFEEAGGKLLDYTPAQWNALATT